AALCEGELGFAPAAEDEAAQGEPQAERADGEGADRERLAHGGEPLPAAERLLLLGGQRLAAPAFAQCAACPEPEVEVVKDLGRFFRHGIQCIACFGVTHEAPPPLRYARRKRGRNTGRERPRVSDRARR